MIGFDLYLFYGMKNSIQNQGNFSLDSYKVVSGSGLGMVLALIVVAFIHHNDPEIDDHFLFYFSMIFAAIHAMIFAYSYKKAR